MGPGRKNRYRSPARRRAPRRIFARSQLYLHLNIFESHRVFLIVNSKLRSQRGLTGNILLNNRESPLHRYYNPQNSLDLSYKNTITSLKILIQYYRATRTGDTTSWLMKEYQFRREV